MSSSATVSRMGERTPLRRQGRSLSLPASVFDKLFSSGKVLEVACGTGYWTQFIAREARSVLATDAEREPLLRLESRVSAKSVRTLVKDAYELADLGRFNAAFAGLWFSHVPTERRQGWLQSLHACLEPGSRIVLLDNSEVQCERLPIIAHDKYGNTYQEYLNRTPRWIGFPNS